MTSNYVFDARDAGFTVFGLNGVDEKGNCECGNPECTALYKHPRNTSWQHTPFYSEQQFQVMIDIGHLETGYGVLIKDLFVIDVDVRNGGHESFKQLCTDLKVDLDEVCGFIVETGSKDGSKHLYFKSPSPPVALMQNHPSYKGIDFKSSGFVVGCGSKHRSGFYYECEKGHPEDIAEPPLGLIKLLEKRSHFRTQDDHGDVDVTLDDLTSVVMSINNTDGGHDLWLSVGMGLHDVTNGTNDGLEIWDKWAQQYPKYNFEEMEYRYHTFGKCENTISYGTLIHMAKACGYIAPVTFDASTYNEAREEKADPLDISHVDIRKPHGFAGKLVDWINGQCLYPRENLAAAAALVALSCIGGMRHKDDLNGMSLNFIAFGVAGSGSGKEAILQAVQDLVASACGGGAIHGKFKSEQEAIRNLLHHQASFYIIDELGIELRKISNASKRGGAAYLEGLIGFLMSAYSKANGFMPVSGDLKRQIIEDIKKDIAQLNAKADKDGIEKYQDQIDALEKQLLCSDQGIVNPFLSMFGLTTPVTFDELVDAEMAQNGFIARSVIFREAETNPRRKKAFKKEPLGQHLQIALQQLYSGGHSDIGQRVQCIGDKSSIQTTDEAQETLDLVYEYFHELGEEHKSRTGLEAICRRGWEICSKVSLLTAMASRVRTKQDVLYGFAVAKADIDGKIMLAFANDNQERKDMRGDALLSKIIMVLDKDTGMTLATVQNRMRKFDKSDVEKACDELVRRSIAIKDVSTHKGNGKTITKYLLAP